MPYARPSTLLQTSPSNGGLSLLAESLNSTAAHSMDTASSTQHGEDSPGLLSPNPSTNWQQTVSNTFNQLSMQFQAAAQAVSSVPVASDQAIAALMERLQAIEDGQRRLAQELAGLREEFMMSRENAIQPASPMQAAPSMNGDSMMKSTTDYEAMLKTQQEAAKLEQERLPARLQNALAVKSKSPLRMPPMKNKKTPPNAPATRGEFEHLTKERYEALLQAYEVPYSGDTAAKRETLRAFLGIPAMPLP